MRKLSQTSGSLDEPLPLGLKLGVRRKRSAGGGRDYHVMIPSPLVTRMKSSSGTLLARDVSNLQQSTYFHRSICHSLKDSRLMKWREARIPRQIVRCSPTAAKGQMALSLLLCMTAEKNQFIEEHLK